MKQKIEAGYYRLEVENVSFLNNHFWVHGNIIDDTGKRTSMSLSWVKCPLCLPGKVHVGDYVSIYTNAYDVLYVDDIIQFVRR